MVDKSTAKNDRRKADVAPIPRWRLLLYALIPCLVIFGGIELALRIAGFEFHGIPRHMQFGPNLNADFRRNVTVPDDVLFWRLRVDDDNAAVFARRRLVHPDLDDLNGVTQRRPTTFRVVSLGDSCTFFGTPSYPTLLEQELVSRGLDAQVFNASLPGYSSLQGKLWFETEIADYRPDWITVYFGWNDHWLALRAPDHRLVARRSFLSNVAGRAAEHVRILQAVLRLWTRASTPAVEERPLRVPQDEYRANLNALCRDAHAIGARVVFITAASDLDAGDLRRLRDQRYVADPEKLPALHESYNQVVREVAAACGAELLDFSAEATGGSGVISADGIHLTPEGVQWLASHLAEAIAGDSEE